MMINAIVVTWPYCSMKLAIQGRFLVVLFILSGHADFQELCCRRSSQSEKQMGCP